MSIAAQFDLRDFFAGINGGSALVTYPAKEVVFTQGDPCDAVFYIVSGQCKSTVISSQGKEAVVAIHDKGAFFGEGCLTGQVFRLMTVTAMTECKIMRIEKASMISAIHNEEQFSDLFMAHLLSRNARVEEDLVDQLFNSSEKRLARALLLMANFGKEGAQERVITKVTQETLAEMVGTTRSRVSHFMNKFRKLGFIEYNGELLVHNSLLNIVLHDNPALRTKEEKRLGE